MLNTRLISPKLSLTQQPHEKYNVQEQVFVVYVSKKQNKNHISLGMQNSLYRKLCFYNCPFSLQHLYQQVQNNCNMHIIN